MAGPTIGTVGAKSNPSQNTNTDQSFGISGAQRVQDAHGKYSDLAMRGKIFLAANQAGAAVTNLSTTCTGLALSNTSGSVVWGALLHVGFIQTSTATTTANAGILLAGATVSATAVTHTTPLTVRSSLNFASGGTLLADSSATLPVTPVSIMSLWQPSVSATATTGIPAPISVFVDGLVIISPGSNVSMSALSALSGATSMYWEEFPVPTNYA